MDEQAYLREVSLKRESIEDFDTYPFSIPVIKHLDRLKFSPDVTFIIGENGSGKSTLIEAIAVALGFNAEGGTKNFAFGTHDNHSDLYKYLRLVRTVKRPRNGFFLRAESFYNVATNIEALDRNEPGAIAGPPIIDSYGGISLHEQSHGESFLSLLLHRFSGNGLYILDEPEAALSPVRQLSVLSRMNQLVKKNSQFIIATHSPILLAYPGATIYQITDEQLEKVSYKDTEHYEVTRSFLENPEKMIEILFEDMDDQE